MRRSPGAVWVCCFAAAADVELAREHALGWTRQRFGSDCGGTREEQLPIALSPSGSGPPTVHLCVFACTPEVAEAVQVYLTRLDSPIAVAVQDKASFLAERGLLEIDASG